MPESVFATTVVADVDVIFLLVGEIPLLVIIGGGAVDGTADGAADDANEEDC